MTALADLSRPLTGTRIAFASLSPPIRERDGLRTMAHGLLRQLAGLPAQTEIYRDTVGAPRINARGAPGISITYASNLVFVATDPSRIGIDAERDDVATDLIEGLAHFCHPDEIAWIGRLPAAERRRAAVNLWTGKEAFVKYAGQGFRIDPRSIRVTRRTGCGATEMKAGGFTAHIRYLRGAEINAMACHGPSGDLPGGIVLAIAKEGAA